MDQTLRENLHAPIKSFRIFALEQAIQSGNSPELLEVLQEHQSRETDDECKVLLAHAIASVSQRIRPDSSQTETGGKPFEELADAERISWLSGLSPRAARSLAGSAPGWFEATDHLLVRTLIVRKFCAHWPEEQFSLLLAAIPAASLSLKIAILDSLARVRPGLLKPSLPDLLRAEDPGLRFVAIRILAAVDIAEAVKFVSHYLLTGNSAAKLTGIQLSFYLPFDQIKPALFQFFAVENDSRLLTRAALLFSINPDREVPFRLWEIAEICAPEKKALLQKVVQSACGAIKTSGMLGEELPEFLTRLQKWIRRRVLDQFLQRLLTTLEETPDLWDDLVDQEVLAKLRSESGAESLAAARSWGLSDRQAALLDRLSVMVKKPEPASESFRPRFHLKEFLGTSEEEQIRILQTCLSADSQELRKVLPRLFQEAQGRNRLLAAIIKVSARLEEFSLADQVLVYLQHSNQALQEAAAEFFLAADPLQLIPNLGGFLNSPNPRIKTLAIQALKAVDQPRALDLIRGMLESPRSEVKRQALTNLGYLDFSLVREPLTAFLRDCRDSQVFRAGLCLFDANPDSRNLYFLNQIRDEGSGDRAALVDNLCRRTEERLVAEGQITAAELVALKASFGEELRQEEDKRLAPPAYAFSRVHQTGRATRVVWNELLISFFTDPRKMGVVALLLLLGGFLLFIGTRDLGSEFSPVETRFPAVPPETSIQGTVLKADRQAGVFCIKTVAGDQYLVYPDGAPWDRFPEGAAVRARVVAVRLNSRNQILCEGRQFDRP